MTTDSQSIEVQSHLRLFMRSEPKLNDIIRDNSRFKQAGCERVFVRNGNSVKNLNTLAHISLLSVAIAAVVTKKDASYRSVKTLKRLS